MYRHSLFLRPEGPAKMLVGEPPQTRLTSGHFVPKWRRIAPFVCGLSLSLLCLIFPPAGCAEQVVDVGLDCHGLPHILLGLAVFRIKGLFLFGQLTAGFLSASILGSLAPARISFIAALAAR